MASPGRTRPSNAASRPHRGPTALPPYQPPANKLNDAAQRALYNLPNTHCLDGLHKRLKQANVVLSNTAGEINDRYYQKALLHQRRQARRRAQGAEDNEEEDDPALEKLREEVEDMTSRIEQSVRMIINSKHTVEEVETSLKELDANITAGKGAVAPTQSTLGASQLRQNRRKRGMETDEEEADESADETASQAVGDGPALLLKKKIAAHNSAYEESSMQERYASNNDYVGFRKIIHDALHPGDDAPPMPKASTWFLDSQGTLDAASDGASKRATPTTDDEEVTIASEKKSLKCPITLLTMTDPLSSTKCPHSFERSAILGMLELSERPPANGCRGAQGVERRMKCPECSVELTAADLQSDPVLIRRIKRLQAAEAMEEGDSDDDGDEQSLPRGTQKHQAEPISSDNERDHPAISRARSVIPRIKAEKLASTARVRDVSMVPDSQSQGLIREDERPSSTAESEVVDLEDSNTENGEG